MHTLSAAGIAGLHDGNEHVLVDTKGRLLSISLNQLTRLAEQLCGECPVSTSNRQRPEVRVVVVAWGGSIDRPSIVGLR